MNLATLTQVIQTKMEEEAAINGKKSIRKENGNKKEFRCEECGRTFPAKQNLGTHMRRYHKTEILVCPVAGCNKTYKHRWDLTSHTKVAHNGEKVMCPNCGSCFSKKSNLYNHLHRGKGCPKRGEGPDSPVQIKRETERSRLRRRDAEEKIRFAEVKQETGGESDEELSDLVIDDRNQSDIIDSNDVKTETEDDLEDDESEEHVEESYVEVRESPVTNLLQNRFEFLKSQRDLLLPRGRQESESKSTPSPPPVKASSSSSAPLNNLHLLADIAMAHTQYSSDTSSDQEAPDNRGGAEPLSSPVEVTRVRMATPPPLNLTTTARAPATRLQPSPPLLTGYRDIRPGPVTSLSPLSGLQSAKLVTAQGQPVQLLQPAAGQTYKVIPVQTSAQPTAPAPVMVIQSNGGPGHVIRTNGGTGHVIQSNGGTGHVSHVPSGLIQLTQPSQVIRLAPPGSASLLRTNMGAIQMVPVIQASVPQPTVFPLSSVPSHAPTPPKTPPLKPEPLIKTEPLHLGSPRPEGERDLVRSEPDTRSDQDSDQDHETDTGSDSGSSSGLSGGAHVRCPTCGRVCSDPAHLSNHIKLVHSNITSKIERKKTLKCHICNKLFGRSSHLAEHIKSVHEGNKRVYQKAVCGQCGRVFARKCSLNQHITQAHGAQVNM